MIVHDYILFLVYCAVLLVSYDSWESNREQIQNDSQSIQIAHRIVQCLNRWNRETRLNRTDPVCCWFLKKLGHRFSTALSVHYKLGMGHATHFGKSPRFIFITIFPLKWTVAAENKKFLATVYCDQQPRTRLVSTSSTCEFFILPLHSALCLRSPPSLFGPHFLFFPLVGRRLIQWGNNGSDLKKGVYFAIFFMFYFWGLF